MYSTIVPDLFTSVIIAPLSLLVGWPPFGVWMRLPFCIFKLQGDGNLHFVEALATFDDAKTRVREIGELWPGESGIENVESGTRVLVSTRDEGENYRTSPARQ